MTNDKEYLEFLLRDTLAQTVPALAIYALALTLYWTVIA